MDSDLKQGKIEEFDIASANRISLTIYKRSFDNQMIKTKKIIDGTIGLCSFIKASLIDVTFENCIFIKTDFSTASLVCVKFINCKFNECNFSNTEFKHVSFEGDEGVLNNCKFDGVDLKNTENISGVDEKDLNVLSEDISKYASIFEKFGFIDDKKGSYVFTINEDHAKVSIYYDDEADEYRATLFVNGQPILTSELSISSEFDESYNETKFSNDMMDLLCRSYVKEIDSLHDDSRSNIMDLLMSILK